MKTWTSGDFILLVRKRLDDGRHQAILLEGDTAIQRFYFMARSDDEAKTVAAVLCAGWMEARADDLLRAADELRIDVVDIEEDDA